MKNYWLLITVLVIAGLFSSCQKDDELFDELEQSEQQTEMSAQEFEATKKLENTQKEKVKSDEADDEVDFSKLKKMKTIEIETDEADKGNSKSGRERIFSKTYIVPSGTYLPITHSKNVMDSNCRYIIEVTRYNGDPDLYVYAGQAFGRLVRRADSHSNGNEETYSSYADMRSYEDQLVYAIIADGYSSAQFKIEVFKDCDSDPTCSDILTGCEMVTCTPQAPTFNDGYYCGVTTTYNGEYAIQRWEVRGENGEDVSNQVRISNENSSTPTIVCHQPGTYVICVYYICNGVVYKCCQVVTCPPTTPTNNCCSNPLSQNWLQNIITGLCSNNCTGEKIYCATYNGRPAIHVTPWESCTDGMGKVYDCYGNVLGQYGGFGGTQLSGTLTNHELLWNSANDCDDTGHCNNFNTLQREGFDNYSYNARIAQSSNQWDTWDFGRAGTSQDPLLSTYHNMYSLHLNVSRDNVEDVIYKLGNRTNGNYELTFDIKVRGAGYFNIQGDQNNRESGGVFQTFFRTDGQFYVRTNGGGQSSLFPYTKNDQVKVTVKADFNNRDFSVQIGNNNPIKITSAQNFFRLGGINFYAVDGADFDIDNIELKGCN